MPILPISLIKGDKIDDRCDYRDSLPVNTLTITKNILGVNGYVRSFPGLSSHASGLGIDRGGVYNERFNLHLRVSGTSLISIDSNGSTSVLGTIPGTSQCIMKDFKSFNTQGIITDGLVYLYSPNGGLVQITDTDLGTPLDACWINGYYFFTDGEYIYHTNISDETVIDPLKFATAEFMPDRSIGVAKTQDNKVIVFGRYSLEYFADVANENFAFSRIETRSQKIGIVATGAKVESKASFYIVGSRMDESLSVYSIGVGSSDKISSREIDIILGKYTDEDLADIKMESIKIEDITLILIHLPDETLCFNETLAQAAGLDNAWSILKSDISGDTPYRGINFVYDPDAGKWVTGDKYSTYIGFLDYDECTQYGSEIESIIDFPFLRLPGKSIDSLNIQTITGFSTTDDAKVYISITKDGITHGQEWHALYGTPKEYNHQFFARRLSGYIKNFVGIRLRWVSKSRMAFSSAEIGYS